MFSEDGWLYPDSLVGTDSHTTMINGLGVVGWGVGGMYTSPPLPLPLLLALSLPPSHQSVCLSV